MKGTEQALLQAVRARLRLATGSGGAGYADAQCDIEYTQMAAATAPDVFVCVNPNGFRAGPHHSTSGTQRDMLLGVEVTVFRRMTWIARDRKRNVYMTGSTTLQDDMDRVFEAIDWKYEVITAANTILAASPYSSSEKFYEPLAFTDMDPKPWDADPSMVFAAVKDTQACLARSIRFFGARRGTVIV